MRTSNKIAFMGVMLALVLVTLFIAVLMPMNRLFFTALSSVFVAMVIMEINVAYGWMFYLASSVLAFLLIPLKSIALLYAALFGIYGIVKGYIEKIRDRRAEMVLKLLFFNASIFIIYKAASLVAISQAVQIPRWPIIVLWLIAQVAFLIYDYAYTLFLRIYQKRIRRFTQR